MASLTVDTTQPITLLGIETSCDETGVAVVRLTPRPGGLARGEVLGQALHSQTALHAQYGGVVPELASRDHVKRLIPLIEKTLAEARIALGDISAIAYTEGPGLAGALLVGAAVAQGISVALSKPILGVHHLEGHLLSPLLETNANALASGFPFLALLVSGGHTQIMQVDAIGQYTLLGETIDDAAGEAFDKSAQLLGLGYPGGPQIGEHALKGDAKRFDLPRPLLKKPTLDFSFAGLKTAVLTQVQALEKSGPLSEGDRCDLAAGVQSAICDVLTGKCKKAIEQTGVRSLVVAGGVGANQELRRQMADMGRRLNVAVMFPPPALCTDNGVMIAWAAGLKLMAGTPARTAGSFSVLPRWPLCA